MIHFWISMSVVFMCRGCGDLSENNNKSIRENVLFEERREILFQNIPQNVDNLTASVLITICCPN